MMMKKELEFASDTSLATEVELYFLAKILLICIRLALKNKPNKKTANILKNKPSKFQINMAKKRKSASNLYLKRSLFKNTCETIR